MASTADQLTALGNDSNFRFRLQSLLVQQAAVVYAEDPATTNHVIRAGYAKNILANPAAQAQVVAMVIVNRTNLVAGNTTYDFATSHVHTDVTDAAISSQLASVWNMLSGV